MTLSLSLTVISDVNQHIVDFCYLNYYLGELLLLLVFVELFSGLVLIQLNVNSY